MAAGNLDDPLSDIPNVVLVDQSAATAAPGAGYVRVEAVNGVLGIRVGSGAWTPMVALVAGILDALAEKETPASGDLLLLQDEADGSALKKVDVDNLPGGAGGGLFDAYLCYADEKAQNTSGGQGTTGAWNTRTLNTERADTAGIGTLAADQVTLPAGTYVCNVSVPFYRCTSAQARLYDATGAAVLVIGTSLVNSYVGSGYSATGLSLIAGSFTLGVESVIQVEYRISDGTNVNNLGIAANFGTEVYTVAEFWRLAA